MNQAYLNGIISESVEALAHHAHQNFHIHVDAAVMAVGLCRMAALQSLNLLHLAVDIVEPDLAQMLHPAVDVRHGRFSQLLHVQSDG